MHIKNISGEKVTYLHFCVFAWASLCFFVLLFGCVFVLVRMKSFCKKIKRFKTALMTSFTLLLNLSCYKYKFLYLQVFSIITILLNHQNLFQSSIFLNLSTTCENKPTYEFHHLTHLLSSKHDKDILSIL